MSFSNYEQTVIINGVSLSGVQDVNGSYGISEKPIRVAGVGFVDALIDSPLEGSFTITRKMVSSDPLLASNVLGSYDFDEQEISGAILYDNAQKGFGFTRGRVSRYAVSCSVGEIPTIETEVRVFGQLGASVLNNDLIKMREGSTFLPFNGDNVYLTNEDESVIVDRSENFKTQWNDQALLINQDAYNRLSPETRLVKSGAAFSAGINLENNNPLQGSLRYSDWFFIAQKNTTNELRFNLNFPPSTMSNDDLESWVYNLDIGWLYISALGLNHETYRELWFSSAISVDGQSEAVWMYTDENILSSSGAVWFSGNDQSIISEGWSIFFADPFEEYKAIFYHFEELKWYGLYDLPGTFSLTHLTSLNGRDLSALPLSANDIKSVAPKNSIKRLFAFGDSYSDSGNYPDSLWLDRQKVWCQYVAGLMFLDFEPSSEGGRNYAFGGARLIENVDQGNGVVVPSILSQINSVAEPFLENDLICFFGGGNDYIGHSESASYISQNYLQCIQALYDNGARNLVLLNMLDLYSMPSVVDPSATQVSIDVNESISSIPSLFADANIYIYDFYSKLNDILADPVSYGISDSPFYDDTHLNQQVHSEIANQIYTTFIAQVQPDILALGKDSFDLYDKAINPHPPIQFPDQSSIKVKVSDFEIDAISDFSFSRTLNLSPIYAIHQGDSQDWENGKSSLPNLEPVQIDTQYPIENRHKFHNDRSKLPNQRNQG